MATDLNYMVFSEGLMFLRHRRLAEASNAFKRAYNEERGNPRYLSYYGLTVALLEQDFPRAISLCRAAIEHAPFEPEYYLNLCRVHHEAGQRKQALIALRDGLGFQKDNTLLQMALRKMGIRRKPPLSFLPREHLLNKFLGKLTFKLRKRRSSIKGSEVQAKTSPPTYARSQGLESE